MEKRAAAHNNREAYFIFSYMCLAKEWHEIVWIGSISPETVDTFQIVYVRVKKDDKKVKNSL